MPFAARAETTTIETHRAALENGLIKILFMLPRVKRACGDRFLSLLSHSARIYKNNLCAAARRWIKCIKGCVLALIWRQLWPAQDKRRDAKFGQFIAMQAALLRLVCNYYQINDQVATFLVNAERAKDKCKAPNTWKEVDHFLCVKVNNAFWELVKIVFHDKYSFLWYMQVCTLT
jgi:hypothetical protein